MLLFMAAVLLFMAALLLFMDALLLYMAVLLLSMAAVLPAKQLATDCRDLGTDQVTHCGRLSATGSAYRAASGPDQVTAASPSKITTGH